MKKIIFTVLIAISSTIAIAQTDNSAEHTNLKNGIAIQGYDPVAYFTVSKPTPGDKTIQATYEGATYYFTSQENKDAFTKNPEQYVPQYGGFCAYGMSEGYKAPVKPESFTIVNNKLYLNYNLKVREDWSKNKEARIAKATVNWEKIKK